MGGRGWKGWTVAIEGPNLPSTETPKPNGWENLDQMPALVVLLRGIDCPEKVMTFTANKEGMRQVRSLMLDTLEN